MTYAGVDLSNYQGVPDVEQLRALDLSFAYIKITQGSDYKNPDAPAQRDACAAAGIAHIGYYHFVTMDDQLDQLNNLYFMSTSMGETKLPVAFDIETTDPAGWPALASMVMKMALAVEGWTNYLVHPRTLLYANLTFYHDLPGFPWGRWVWLADPNPGAPHEPCLILQGAPRPEGPFSNVDPDTFQGTAAQWATFTGTTPSSVPVSAPQPTPSPQENPMAVSQPLNYRSGQYDVFQIDAGHLIHYFHDQILPPGTWNQEDLAVITNTWANFQGTPTAAVLGGACVVIAEDTNGDVHCFTQGATGPWESAKA